MRILRALFFFAIIFLISCQRKEKVAPDFLLFDLDNKPVCLKDYRGKIVLLDFWATWCYACRMSIPKLIKLQEKYKDKGFSVLSISLDNPEKVSNEDLKRFKNEVGINYRILRYNMKVISDYFGDNKLVIPTMFIIDRDGKIKAKIEGFRPELLEKTLERILG